TREERLAKAKAIISTHGYMTLTDYALATGQSKSTASDDLKKMVVDPDSGITTRGQHSHKIWIKR
ncbi:MAG: DNA-binding protein, partial [Prevotella sp.]|nr:DNA-binding protein [Prevotella sp.]